MVVIHKFLHRDYNWILKQVIPRIRSNRTKHQYDENVLAQAVAISKSQTSVPSGWILISV